VAIKVLPEMFSQDPERLSRFQRDAELLASVNHPNIAAIYGLETTEAGAAIVLELVDSQTLTDVIARGAVPIDEALPIARAIADALEAAHEKGIVHRDLKPANVKMRDDGAVKVLDFGLAKIMQVGGARGASGAGGVNWAASMSPTITTPAVTMAGVHPRHRRVHEPRAGAWQDVDRRADIWAFGCCSTKCSPAGRRSNRARRSRMRLRQF
jgi:serine/threonine-protein kinase